MKEFDITGMSCAACSARIEKAVSKVENVNSVSVNLLTNSMAVDGTADNQTIIDAVVNAGYGASVKGTKNKSSEKESIKDTQTPQMIKRLVASVVLLIPLMYVSMGHMMWGWRVPEFLNGNHLGIALFEFILTVAVMVINQRFFVSGFKGVIHKAPNMDTLVALGSGAAFVYSTVIMFLMTFEIKNGNTASAHEYMHDLYFESAAMILALITVGKTLEAYSKGKTTNALKSLMDLSPKTAVVLKNGVETTVPVEEVALDDIVVIKAGSSVPVDAKIISGDCSVDESALTGESIPVDKTIGDKVSAGTVNLTGYARCRAVSVGEDTDLSKIIKMVADASATKAPIAKIADKVSGVFVPVVVSIALVTFVAWLISGSTVGFALARSISVLVISCPCALGLATPVAIMVGSGKGAKNGILFKTAESLEITGKSQIVCFDKTGTVTNGNPVVTDVVADDVKKLLFFAYSVEAKSEHPLSKAVNNYCKEKGVNLVDTLNYKTVPGGGVTAEINGKTAVAGNIELVSQYVNIENKFISGAETLAQNGKTPLFFAYGGDFLGIIAVADTVREDSIAAVNMLKNSGVSVVMITGDNNNTAAAVAKQVGIDNVISKVLPGEKQEKVAALQKFGSVAMVGDGINDAPALTAADTGIAIGAGTDVAIDAADVVLMKSSPLDVAKAINLSRRVLLNIKENLFWAFIYNVIGIPVAAGVLYPAFGLTLNPMIAAAAMSLSSFCVVMNALRLNIVNINKITNSNKKGIKIDMSIFNKSKNNKPYVEIEGMMCPNCEHHVTQAFAEIGLDVTANHSENKAYINSGEIDEEKIKSAVTSAGYKFIKVVK